ncbi:MAG: nitroreductase [Clostridia bacterium]|nr:nitroreductase [Clostridia bacterium]
MDTFEALTSRRSVRSYTNDVITEENLERILAAAEAAPVAMGRYEDLHLTVITDARLLDRIDRATAKMMGDEGKQPLYGAPMLIVVSVRRPEPGRENAVYSSAACVVENMALEAVALNVGACHIWGAIRAVNASNDLAAQLELPEGFIPSCGIILGQTEEEYKQREVARDRIRINYVR